MVIWVSPFCFWLFGSRRSVFPFLSQFSAPAIFLGYPFCFAFGLCSGDFVLVPVLFCLWFLLRRICLETRFVYVIKSVSNEVFRCLVLYKCLNLISCWNGFLCLSARSQQIWDAWNSGSRSTDLGCGIQGRVGCLWFSVADC